MTFGAVVFFGLIIVAAVYAIVLYNGLVEVKHAVSRAWANIDVLLKQRHDELPKLVETCKQYRDFESATLERVIAARSQAFAAREKGDVAAVGAAEGGLRASLGRLFAVAESYPELKTNEQFLHLQRRITQLEETIADRREVYNDCVNINNVKIEQFPEILLAKWFHFTSKTMLEFAAIDFADVDISSLFKGT